MTPIHYTIIPVRPEAHLYRVTCTVDDPDPSGQRLALPAWVPGSYMIRDFARHVVSIRAASRGRAIAGPRLSYAMIPQTANSLAGASGRWRQNTGQGTSAATAGTTYTPLTASP